MKAKGRFISFLLIVDTALGGFTYGFNSRHCLIIDPNLPPVKPPVQEKSKPVQEKSKPAQEKSKSVQEKSKPVGKDAAKKTSAKGHGTASGIGASKTKKHKAGNSANVK
jgi:hypothetical protein